MKRVAIVYSSRSEEGLLRPVIRRLREVPGVEVLEMFNTENCDPQSLGFRYLEFWHLFKLEKPDLVFCSFDRKEMLPVAYAAFLQNIPVAQIHAGDISLEGTWDDLVRHAISLMATLLFCNGNSSHGRMLITLHNLGRTMEWCKDHVFETGSTALDDIAPDYTDVPEKDSFDLVLYSAPTTHPEVIDDELKQIDALLNKRTLIIGPTVDPGADRVSEWGWVHRNDNPLVYWYYPGVRREIFLALMDRCDRFIGNSSSIWTESLAFKERSKLIPIGVRNQGRDFIKPEKGGSDRIVQHVREFLGE